jgi:hypothetical protein
MSQVTRKECVQLDTVGELKAWLAELPDELPIGRMTNGYYRINITGDVSFFVGHLPVGRPEVAIEQVILRISA